ncbi:B-cell differentiation antigen CD72 isoform X2 [Meriones unguiculatus]|uniref:B-cell differentiation antigen CD72 isoform X2 n=1 Tax=Meriones unguiculatus TaxID=10047 RepID=UPI00293EFC04|nr:B-cell differentiation antigen CD72 isoform X2 [Meriones unguiculatus]
MADAITYADLRFVKGPLKSSLSNHMGQGKACLLQSHPIPRSGHLLWTFTFTDGEAYEDGELTYENVQVSSVPGVPSGWASPALVDKAGVKSEQPNTASWSSAKLSAVGWIPPCPTVCLQYFLLGLLLACLMLGMAVICLGVRYLQVSQQFRQVTRILEATNSSLQQQLREKTVQLGQKEVDLQESQRELTLSQDTLQEKQKIHETTEQQLQACQSEGQRTRENLEREERQRQEQSQRWRNMQDKLRPFFTCPDSCCPLGWLQQERRCFYVSHTLRSWEESQKYCTSLSSKLAVFTLTSKYSYQVLLPDGLEDLLNVSKSYWIQQTSNYEDYYMQNTKKQRNCNRIAYAAWSRTWRRQLNTCSELYPCICELEAFRFPDISTEMDT